MPCLIAFACGQTPLLLQQQQQCRGYRWIGILQYESLSLSYHDLSRVLCILNKIFLIKINLYLFIEKIFDYCTAENWIQIKIERE